MTETPEQAEFRRHLGELRKAAGGIGRDFHAEFSQLNEKIDRLTTATARDAKDLALDIQDDLTGLARSIGEEARRLPHAIREAGSALGSGTARAAGAAKDAVVTAGHRAKEGTKNAFAAAAGVKRTPMKSWSPPTSDDGKDEPGDGSG